METMNHFRKRVSKNMGIKPTMFDRIETFDSVISILGVQLIKGIAHGTIVGFKNGEIKVSWDNGGYDFLLREEMIIG